MSQNIIKKKIAFVVRYPRGVSPAQRFRFECWEPLLKAQGWQVDTFPFIGAGIYGIMHQPGRVVRKAASVVAGYFKRLGLLCRLPGYDYVLLQREFAPLGPPVFEWIATKILRTKIIYDFDDAIWIPNVSKSNAFIVGLRAFWKTATICRWAYKVSAGNQYLCNYAKAAGAKNVVLLPTTVDMATRYTPLKQTSAEGPVVIGWTGSHSTLQYLQLILPVLQEIDKEPNVEFLIICDKKPDLPLRHLRFTPWNEATEIADLIRIDIGIMPLTTDAWAEGKCGFKLIQYLALGIPAVATPIGVNSNIIEEGGNGYLCATQDEWVRALKLLIQDAALRRRLGQAGKLKMAAHYSLQSQSDRFLELFS